MLIDYECWSEFLEETECFPSDFQIAIKDLIKERKVKNLDANVSRRRSKFIKSNWPVKSERWVII